MPSGGDNAVLNVICSAEGVVLFQAPTRVAVDEPVAEVAGKKATSRAGDGFRTDGGGASAVGTPLVKTFWFDHLDCDQRELQQILRKAGNGHADRVRVWVRVDEHQLIRAELTATPMFDETGRARQVLIRTEPTRPSPRRRDAGPLEPTEKSVRLASDSTQSAAPIDLLALRMGVPMLRVEVAGGSVVTANDAFAELIGKPAADCASVPLSEFVHPADRKPIVEAIAAARGSSAALSGRASDVRLRAATDDALPTRLSFVPDPATTADRPTLIVVAHDRSQERRIDQLTERAQKLGEGTELAAESLKRFERFFDRAPFGLALFENAQPLRTNAAFEAQSADSAGWVDALAHRALKAKSAAEQHSTRQSIASFWLGDDAAPSLVGTVITPAPRTAAAFELRLESTLRAMELGGRLAAIVIEPGGELRPLGKTLDAIAPNDASNPAARITPELLFDDASLGEYRSVTAHARTSKGAVTARLILRDRGPCHATFAPFDDGGGAMLLLIEDVSAVSAQIDASRERVRRAISALETIRASSIDPAEVERLRRQLAERRDQVRAVLEATDSGGFSWDLIDGQVHADARTRELLGCDASAALTPAMLLAAAPAEERTAFERQLFDAMSPDSDGQVDLRLHIGEQAHPVRVVGHVVFEDRSESTSDTVEAKEAATDPARFVAAVLDLSDERRSQAQLAETESKRDELAALLRLRTAELNAIFECAPDAIRIRSNGMMRHNSAAALLFGDDLGAFFNANDNTTSAHIVDGNGDPLPVNRALSGEIGSALIQMRHRDDETRIVQSNAAPIVLDGAIVGAVSIETDLTEQRQSEASLRDYEEQIAGFFQNTGVGVAYLDAKGAILDVNPQLSVLLGYGREDLLGHTLHERSTVEDRAILAGQIEAVLSGELASCSSELRLKRRDGAACWTQLTIAPRHASAGDGERSVVAIVQDIDELRRLRETTATSTASLSSVSERYELISGTIAEGFVLLDPSGRVVEANDAARRMLDLRTDSDGAFDHLQFESPETTAVVTERFPWQRALRGKATTAEYRVRRRTGSGKGEVETKSLVVQFAASPAPQRMAVVNVRDITARHGLHEDLQHAYARIVEAHTMLQQRTKQLEGNFVSAVQQLGAAVGASAPLARAMLADTRLAGESRDAARQLVDAFRVHDRLVQHFVADTAADGAAAAPVRATADLHTLIEEATRLVTERFHITGRITRSLVAERPTCRVDGALVRHAFWSVLAHAASQSAKVPTKVETANTTAADGSGRLQVTVTWPGARSNTAELTLARALIESERGTLAITSSDGFTTATVELELAGSADETSAPSADSRMMRVLLVEDHESTARVLSRQLARLRCEVTQARTLAEAKAAIEAKDAAFDLIVCDMTMPDGNANDFVRRAASQRKLPTIGLRSYGGSNTNYGDEPPASKSVAGLVEQLVKPVDLNALAAAIARITGRAEGRTR